MTTQYESLIRDCSAVLARANDRSLLKRLTERLTSDWLERTRRTIAEFVELPDDGSALWQMFGRTTREDKAGWEVSELLSRAHLNLGSREVYSRDEFGCIVDRFIEDREGDAINEELSRTIKKYLICQQ